MTMLKLTAGAVLHHADCRDVLRSLPDNSIDSVCTDPPYALVSIVKRFGGANAAPAKDNDAYMRASAGFMNAQWDVGDTAFSIEFWAEVFRVLKPGGHVAAFGGTRTQHRLVCAIEDAGFEIRDQLYWHYGSGFPKSQNVAKFIDKELGVKGSLGGPRSAAHAVMLEAGVARRGEKHEGWDRPWMDDPEAITAAQSIYIPASPEAQKFDGYGTALKPATEPICLARKPLSEGTVAANVLRWGTGALNIGATRIVTSDNLNGGAYSGGSKNLADATSYATGVNAGTFVQPTGRWPANVVHDGSDEVVGAFPDSKGQQGVVTGKEASTDQRYILSGLSGNHAPRVPRNDSGSAARFFYSAKASKTDRNGSKHPTVKPIALMQWLARLITPPGGTVLDPFAGSGTTGAACEREGFSVVLCERETEYVEDIRRRFALPDAEHPWSRVARWNAAVLRYKAAA